jgi:addiction module HigA family antidote
LREEFRAPFGLNLNKPAIALRAAPPDIYEIVGEKRGISGEMALRLGRFLRTTPEFWRNLQAHYKLAVSRQEAEEKIRRDVRPMTEISS